MSNEGMQQLEREEKIRKAVSSVAKSVNTLQWEMDRVSSGGQIELKRLESETTELERLCR